MPGFDNSVMYADNVDFSGASPVTGKVTLDGQLLIGSTVSPNIRVANISAGAGISITNGSGAITIAATGMFGLTWNTITSATNVNPISVFNAYITTGGVLVTLLLPAAANVGDIFIITGLSALFSIHQNAGQSIILGALTSTIGVGGRIDATMVSDHVEIVCVTANTVFKIIDSVGNLTVV